MKHGNLEDANCKTLYCFWILFFVQSFPPKDHLKNNPDSFN